MPYIVQFTHPGAEHQPDKNNIHHTSWNKKISKNGKINGHKRKFLLSTGSYVKNGTLEEDNLVYWGEWEPPSHVKPLIERPNKYFPTWLHEPYLPEELLEHPRNFKIYHNTDPCIFGEYFRYFICKQFKPKNQKPTKLSQLDKGSIILFGSTANQNKADAFFQLDTVFVVSDYIEYDVADPNALSSEKIYRNYVFKMAFPEPFDNSLKLRMYKGASFENPFEGMYSFSPSQIWDERKLGFPRVPLKNMPSDYINPNLNTAPKITNTSIVKVKEFWESIVQASRSAGCVEGVKFSYKKN